MRKPHEVARGFTLLEVLLAIGIIGVISAIVFSALDPASIFKKSRDTVRYSDMRNINEAIKLYTVDNEHVPYLQNNCSPATPNGDCFTNETPSAPYPWDLLEKDLEPYLAQLPRDPCGIKCFGNNPGNPFFAYNYYAPASFMYNCAGGSCGFDLKAGDAASMYSLYAENLETKAGSTGISKNPFHSY